MVRCNGLVEWNFAVFPGGGYDLDVTGVLQAQRLCLKGRLGARYFRCYAPNP